MELTADALDEWVNNRGYGEDDEENDEIEGGWAGLEEELYYDASYMKTPQPVIKSPFGLITQADDFGGMGKGDEYWLVIQVEQEDGTKRLFKKEGWYQSHYGSELDGDLYEVKSAERVITVWEKV